MLVREYQGQRHTVTVGREGFDWQGATYPSLSAIARAITGTAWNGPLWTARWRIARRKSRAIKRGFAEFEPALPRAPQDVTIGIEQTTGRQRLNIHGAINLETG